MTTPLTHDEIAALRKLCEKATPAPWRTNYKGVVADVAPPSYQTICEEPSGTIDQIEADMAFIAASRAALPRLLDEIGEARRIMGAFIEKWDVVSPSIASAFFIAFQNGPTIEQELKDIRAFLARGKEKEKT